MHRFIKYFFVIFGSISMLQGSDNNNNNDFMLKCRLCFKKQGHGKKLRNGNLQGTFCDEDSFIVHFNRYHLHDKYKQITIYEHIKTLPKGGKKRTNFKVRYGAKKIKTEDSTSIDSSPLLPPIESPTLEYSEQENSKTSQFSPEDVYKEKTVKKTKTQEHESIPNISLSQHQDFELAASALVSLKKDTLCFDKFN